MYYRLVAVNNDTVVDNDTIDDTIVGAEPKRQNLFHLFITCITNLNYCKKKRTLLLLHVAPGY